VGAGIAARAVRAAIYAGENCRGAGGDVARVGDSDSDIAAGTVGVALGHRVDAIHRADVAGILDGDPGIAARTVSATEDARDNAAAYGRQIARIVDGNADIAVIANRVAERRGVDGAGVYHAVGDDVARIVNGDAAVAGGGRGKCQNASVGDDLACILDRDGTVGASSVGKDTERCCLRGYRDVAFVLDGNGTASLIARSGNAAIMPRASRPLVVARTSPLLSMSTGPRARAEMPVA
jgi:hypothetical protein